MLLLNNDSTVILINFILYFRSARHSIQLRRLYKFEKKLCLKNHMTPVSKKNAYSNKLSNGLSTDSPGRFKTWV